MIKPATLWNFLKTCEDTEMVGRVCRLLGRQEVLEATQTDRMMVRMIENDSGWMDEKTAEIRENERIRKNEYRKRKRERNAGKEDVPKCPTGQDGTPECPTDNAMSQTLPTFLPSNKKEEEDGDITRTREGRFSTPTMETVLAFAADNTLHACGKIDEQWAREWYTLMAETDPPWCDLHGRTIVSWQRRLISDWRLERRRRDGGTGGKPGKGRPAGNGERGGGYIDPNFKPLETVKF